MPDALMRALSELSVVDSDAARAAAVRARCHAGLARQVRRAAVARARQSAPEKQTVLIWRPAIVLLGLVYLTEAIGQALRVLGRQ